MNDNNNPKHAFTYSFDSSIFLDPEGNFSPNKIDFSNSPIWFSNKEGEGDFFFEKNDLIQRKVADIVQKSGYGQQELADMIGVQQSQISRWLTGKSKSIPIEGLLRLSEVIEIDWNDLFNFRQFPVFLPSGNEQPVFNLVSIGESDRGQAAIHIDDFNSFNCVFGPERLTERQNLLTDIASGIVSQCRPLLFIDGGSAVDTLLEKISKTNSSVLSQAVTLDFRQQTVPANVFDIKSRQEILKTTQLLESILNISGQDVNDRTRFYFKAAVTAIAEASVMCANQDDLYFSLHDIKTFFKDGQLRQLIVYSSMIDAVKDAFDYDHGSWENLEQFEQDEVIASISLFVDGVEMSGASFFEQLNVIPEVLSKNSIVLIKLPEDRLGQNLIFNILKDVNVSRQTILNNPRLIETDAIISFSKNDMIPLIISDDACPEALKETISLLASRVFYTSSGPGILNDEEIKVGKGEFAIEERGSLEVMSFLGKTLVAGAKTPLHVKQICLFDKNWITGDPLPMNGINDASDVLGFSAWLFKKSVAAKKRDRIDEIKMLFNHFFKSSAFSDPGSLFESEDSERVIEKTGEVLQKDSVPSSSAPEKHTKLAQDIFDKNRPAPLSLEEVKKISQSIAKENARFSWLTARDLDNYLRDCFEMESETNKDEIF